MVREVVVVSAVAKVGTQREVTVTEAVVMSDD